MKILIIGGAGFIGSHITAALLATGHEVTLLVRSGHPELRWPQTNVIKGDMRQLLRPENWKSIVEGMDAVINAAGILQSSSREAGNVHCNAPSAMLKAAKSAGVRKIVHLSAISADSSAGTVYALTKAAFERVLEESDTDYTILRPSLVYAGGSYGGTSLLRSMAGCPFFLPVPGDGSWKMQPVHADDVAAIVLRALDCPEFYRRTVNVAGPEVLTVKEILVRLRCWMGWKPKPILHVPMFLIRIIGRAGDLFGVGPVNTTSIRQMEHGNIGDTSGIPDDLMPRSMDRALLYPAGVQDRLHARLYGLYAPITIVLGMLWIVSGILGLIKPPPEQAALNTLLPGAGTVLGSVACIQDILLGIIVLFHSRTRLLGWFQFLTVCGYTSLLTLINPALWTDAYGPLLKNMPVLLLIAVWSVLRDNR